MSVMSGWVQAMVWGCDLISIFLSEATVAGDRRPLQKVRLRVYGEDGDEAAATDRKEHGGSVVTGARDCEQDCRSSAVHRQAKILERLGVQIPD
jgi:hypothetical protein